MVREVFSLVSVLVIGVGFLLAGDSKNPEALANRTLHARFVKVDVAKNTVTFETTDKAGKPLEATVPLANGAKLLGAKDEPVTITAFAKFMEKHKDKSILVLEGKGGACILEIMDLPSKK